MFMVFINVISLPEDFNRPFEDQHFMGGRVYKGPIGGHRFAVTNESKA